jgi:succinoglycan biosynthesis protein ExoL
VHFAWGIDYFQQGGNSEWLLPNRVYECGRHGGVPIALRSTQTGSWLDNRHLGLVVQDPVQDLERFLRRLDADAYARLEARSRQAPRDWFAASEDDCHDLLHALASA